MTLMVLGPVVFDIRNDLQRHVEESSSAFARHNVLGSSPIYEVVGEDEGTFTLSGMMLPYILGGLDGLARLELSRLSKVPLPLMRGDFVPLGWVLIQSISKTHQELEPTEGVGQEISYDVKLIKVGNPGLSAAADILRVFF